MKVINLKFFLSFILIFLFVINLQNILWKLNRRTSPGLRGSIGSTTDHELKWLVCLWEQAVYKSGTSKRIFGSGLAIARFNACLQILLIFLVSIWLIRSQAISSVLGLDIIWIQIQLWSLPLEAILSSATQHGNPAPEGLPFNTNEKSSLLAWRAIGTHASTCSD